MKKIMMAVVVMSTVLFSCKGEKKEKIVAKEELDECSVLAICLLK